MAGGILTNHLTSMSKKLKPSLQINAYMDSYGGPKEVDEAKYVKEDLKRCKEECAAIKKALRDWVPEDVAARAEKSLRTELKRKEARMAELEARLDGLESEDEEDDEDED